MKASIRHAANCPPRSKLPPGTCLVTRYPLNAPYTLTRQPQLLTVRIRRASPWYSPTKKATDGSTTPGKEKSKSPTSWRELLRLLDTTDPTPSPSTCGDSNSCGSSESGTPFAKQN